MVVVSWELLNPAIDGLSASPRASLALECSLQSATGFTWERILAVIAALLYEN